MSQTFSQLLSMLKVSAVAPEDATPAGSKGVSGSSDGLMNGTLIGLEKENLRVDLQGLIARSDHPAALGAALCNPHITTDYSEALLEVVTPALPDGRDALNFLLQAQRFIERELPENEFIWDTSMPCVIDGVKNIRIGNYGSSNAGKMKSIYRRGLGLRYGKSMQTIAGIHFNLSWPDSFWDHWHQTSGSSKSRQDFVTDGYFSMTRNLLRNGWLIPYLFGSSPAICKTFLQGQPALPSMKTHNINSYYEPFGTSLRMGDIGYQYDKDSGVEIEVDYTTLDSYLTDLLRLISTPHSAYQKLGLTDEAGEIQQLNTNLLQIENEYYSSVRPKQLTQSGESPIHAMHRRGILYLELRSVDVNIFEPAGMCESQLAFLEAFMLCSQLQASPPLTNDETRMINSNMTAVAHRGREPGLKLQSPAGPVNLTDWANEQFDAIMEVAELLDSGVRGLGETNRYREAVAMMHKRVADPDLTPSARVIDEMLTGYPSFHDFAKDKSRQHAATRADLTEDESITRLLQQQVQLSHDAQKKMEAADDQPFEDYLKQYFQQFDAEELSRYRQAGAS